MPNLGPMELVIILLIVVLLFGARKLPDTARGIGRALRIFKSETKGLHDDDPGDGSRDSAPRQEPPKQIPPAGTEPTQASAAPAPERERSAAPAPERERDER